MIYISILLLIAYFGLTIISANVRGRSSITFVLVIYVCAVICLVGLIGKLDSKYHENTDLKALVGFAQILLIGAATKFAFKIWEPIVDHSSWIHIVFLGVITGLGVGGALIVKQIASSFGLGADVKLLLESLAYGIGGLGTGAFVFLLESLYEKRD